MRIPDAGITDPVIAYVSQVVVIVTNNVIFADADLALCLPSPTNASSPAPTPHSAIAGAVPALLHLAKVTTLVMTLHQ